MVDVLDPGLKSTFGVSQETGLSQNQGSPKMGGFFLVASLNRVPSLKKDTPGFRPENGLGVSNPKLGQRGGISWDDLDFWDELAAWTFLTKERVATQPIKGPRDPFHGFPLLNCPHRFCMTGLEVPTYKDGGFWLHFLEHQVPSK